MLVRSRAPVTACGQSAVAPSAWQQVFSVPLSTYAEQISCPPSATDAAAGCVHCEQPLGPDGVPVLAGDAHTWLHSRCHHDWLAKRRAEAERALAVMGVAAAIAQQGHSG